MEKRINILKIGLDAKNVDKKLEQQLDQGNQLFLTLVAQYETYISNDKVLILMFKKIKVIFIHKYLRCCKIQKILGVNQM